MNSLKSKQSTMALLGAIICFIIYIPVIIQGPDMKFVIHDELDGELLTYCLQASHLFESNIPELFDGAAKSALTPPAPAAVLLFIFFSPAVSSFIFFSFVAITSYAGMFLLVNRVTSDARIAASTAALFTCLPFYYVYGLSVMGQPLLVYALFMLWDGKRTGVAYLLILLFAVNSSLVLVGYADIMFGFFFLVAAWLLKQDQRKIGRVFIGGVELILIYILTNIELIKSILFPSDSFVTHKKEWILQSTNFYDRFTEILLNGAYHCASRHKIILVSAIAAIAIGIILRKKFNEVELRYLYLLELLVIAAVLIALFAAFWGNGPAISFRNSKGGPLLYFQIDRFYWLYPVIWFLALALVLKILTILTPSRSLTIAVASVFVLANAWFILEHGTIAENFHSALDPDRKSDSYASISEFYQPDMFKKASEIIGQKKDTYKVGSIGLYPSIALYNGYFCVDGYSNNYSLDYKHEFRKVIAKELERNETIKSYFDNWGNRCYLFSSELGTDYYIHKDSGQQIKDSQLDFEELKRMNCRYLFSTVPIENEHVQLKGKLDDQDSFYNLHIYEIVN